PHRAHVQNCCGVHGWPGAGSTICIWSPQRWHRICTPTSAMRGLYTMAAMLAPIVLAAGRSTRMGAPKALLPDRDGCPFVTRVVRTLVAAGFNDIVVVTGQTHFEIQRVLHA